MSEPIICQHGSLVWTEDGIEFEATDNFETRGWKIGAWALNRNEAAGVRITREQARELTGKEQPTIGDLTPSLRAIATRLKTLMARHEEGDPLYYRFFYRDRHGWFIEGDDAPVKGLSA